MIPKLTELLKTKHYCDLQAEKRLISQVVQMAEGSLELVNLVI